MHIKVIFRGTAFSDNVILEWETKKKKCWLTLHKYLPWLVTIKSVLWLPGFQWKLFPLIKENETHSFRFSFFRLSLPPSLCLSLYPSTSLFISLPLFIPLLLPSSLMQLYFYVQGKSQFICPVYIPLQYPTIQRACHDTQFSPLLNVHALHYNCRRMQSPRKQNCFN